MYSYGVMAIFRLLGARNNPQNFNRGVELQNIDENEKFTGVIFDRFPSKKIAQVT